MNDGTKGVTSGQPEWPEPVAPPVHRSGDMTEHQHTANLIAFLPHTDTALFPVVQALVVERLGLVEPSGGDLRTSDSEAARVAAQEAFSYQEERDGPVGIPAALAQELDRLAEDAARIADWGYPEGAKLVRSRLHRLRHILDIQVGGNHGG